MCGFVWVQSGQPTELALLVAADKMGCRVDRTDVATSLEIPFSSETKWMAVRGRVVAAGGSLTKVFSAGTGATSGGANNAGGDADGADSEPVPGEAFFVKGTTEVVLGMCTTCVSGMELSEAPFTPEISCVPPPSPARRLASPLCAHSVPVRDGAGLASPPRQRHWARAA